MTVSESESEGMAITQRRRRRCRPPRRVTGSPLVAVAGNGSAIESATERGSGTGGPMNESPRPAYIPTAAVPRPASVGPLRWSEIESATDSSTSGNSCASASSETVTASETGNATVTGTVGDTLVVDPP